MTAIVSVHTPDGFIIGADGRRFDSVVRKVASETAKKIFLFESDQIRLAYAWTGMIEASGPTGGYNLQDISEAILLRALSSGHDFNALISAFCAELCKYLPIGFSNLPSNPYELARVMFVGYFKGQPCSAQIVISYVDSVLSPNSEVQIPAQYHKTVFSGAESIYSSKYQQWQPFCRAEAISFVTTYIQECIDSPNPDCAGIGGQIHLGEVQPEGISWIIPPA